MFPKRFFYVCAGLLCLAGSYHLGAQNAGAQAPGNSVAACTADGFTVFTANGDVYHVLGGSPDAGGVFTHVNNVFATGPISTRPETIGRLKARYRTGGER